MTKTNAMRLLDAAAISYSSRNTNMTKAIFRGHHAAQVLGIPAEQVFKTLVTRGDKTGPVVFCIPVDEELDLKKALRYQKTKRSI